MKRNAPRVAHTPQTDAALALKKHSVPFIPVLDTRNRRVPGLSTRNNRFYCQLWVQRPDGRKSPRRFPLLNPDGTPANNLTEAKEAVEVLRSQRREDSLPTDGVKPTFSEFCAEYLASGIVKKKKSGTVENETQALSRWKSHLGSVRIDRISPALVAGFVDKRLKGEPFGNSRTQAASERTVNIDLIALRNVLNAAKTAGHLRAVPDIQSLKTPPARRRSLIATEDLAKLVHLANSSPELRNGEQLADFLQFLAYSGAREQEALRVKWSDVDLVAEFLVIGSDGDTKNRESRVVEMIGDLKEHLASMNTRRAPDSEWLFPSPRRGESDRAARSLRESLNLVRTKAGMPTIGFHHLRVYFTSACVMAGIDYMTIAAWLGHKDGGVLVAKVYGRLRDSHRKDMAAKLKLGGLSGGKAA